MINKLYDIAVVTRKYQDRNGDSKSNWENIGAVFQGDKAPFIMLKAHFNPAGIQRKEGSDSITLYCFPPRQKNNTTQDDFSSQDNNNDFAPVTDIPF